MSKREAVAIIFIARFTRRSASLSIVLSAYSRIEPDRRVAYTNFGS